MLRLAKRAVLGTVRACGYELIQRGGNPLFQPAEPEGPDLDLYQEMYGADVLERRPFLNIGAGSFRHPAWRNVDFETEAYKSWVFNNIDIPWDISEMIPLPVPDNSIEIVYTSHTIEHVPEECGEHVIREALRVLKPGGYLRITCPDMDLYFDAYKRGDRRFFPDFHRFLEHSLEHVLVREFATQLSTANNDNLPVKPIPTEELREIFATLPMKEAFDRICSRIDYRRFYKEAPGNHVSWWTVGKTISVIKEIGYSKVYRSAYGQSIAPALRNWQFFDCSIPGHSLYVEAIK